MTLKNLYEECKAKPTPAQAWVREVAGVTKKTEMTVRLWLIGKQKPDQLTQEVLAKHFKTTKEELFNY